MATITTKNLSYVYNKGTPYERCALDDLSLTIEEGEFVGIIGPTGSGKSTLVQHFNALLEPTSGNVYLDSQDIWKEKSRIREFRFRVGLVFQYPEYQLFEETVYKDIAFGPKNMKLSEDDVNRRVLEAANFVGLKQHHLESSPFELSGGQKRRAAIAGVIAMEPDVLILDEPTAGLDPKGRDRILGQIKTYHQQKKNTVLLVSHSMEDIAKYATKVLVLDKGKIFLYDEPREVFKNGERLREIGLEVPQVTRVFYELGKCVPELSSEVLTVEEGKDLLLRYLADKRGLKHA